MKSVNAVLTAPVLQEVIRTAVAIIVLVKVMMNMQQTITFARGDAAGLPVEVVANEPEVSADMDVTSGRCYSPCSPNNSNMY